MEKETKILKALAHPIRLKIVEKLSKEELCVCKLNEDVEFTQSNLSQHLKILKEANILDSRKVGMWMYYSIKNEEVLKILELTKVIANR
ncbi:ArsR/SmtB family transcription factor [Clostridium senegalense]|uniref:ArsR/SmtB family transcription factor n=1 Tax=Clostridium senegalense TaxID=1465809 RepID=UPI001C10ACEF|nr:metalloregulator ArsR/SmtB family transcription factor [Clostridium senegalense]MBU5225181.1 metalloregulator ArsR/SmtB family transcription factor [Clostridium senegalense]